MAIRNIEKGRRNAIFLLLLAFCFPVVAIINYTFEIQTGIISQCFRVINLSISTLLFFEFIKNGKLSRFFEFRRDIRFILGVLPYALFFIFWIFYFIRMVIDLEVHQLDKLSSVDKNYYYLFTIGVTLIPAFGALLIEELDYEFFKNIFHRYLLGLNLCLLVLFVIDRFYSDNVGYRFYVTKNGFDYLDAITIAVYGGLLVLTSFLNKPKSLWGYLPIILGSFIVLTTASRGPILSILLALLFILFFKDKKLSVRYIYLTLALGLSVGINYLVSLVFDKYFVANNPLFHRLQNFNRDQSTVNRIKIIEDAYEQILDGPIFGTHFLVLESKMYAHNILLDVLLSTGLVGLLLVVPIFLIFARKILYTFNYPLLTVLGFYYFMSAQTSGACFNMTEFWIIFGVIVFYKNNFNKAEAISTDN